MSQFSDLNLNPILLAAVEKMGYTAPTDVQLRVLPVAMGGQDVMVSSQTGSGKTAAFLLPILHQIMAEKELESEPVEDGDAPVRKIIAVAVVVVTNVIQHLSHKQLLCVLLVNLHNKLHKKRFT